MECLSKQPVGDGAVAAEAVVEPVGDPGDGGRGNHEALGDGFVGESLIEHFDDSPSVGKFLKFGKSQKVAEKSGGFLGIFHL